MAALASGSFEWCTSPALLLSTLPPFATPPTTIIDVGCGTSSLLSVISNHLSPQTPLKTIAIDINATALAATVASNHLLHDLTTPLPPTTPCAFHTADLILDKSSLDYFLVYYPPNLISQYLENILTLLHPTGYFHLTTFNASSLLTPILTSLFTTIKTTTVPQSSQQHDAKPTFVYVCSNPRPLQPTLTLTITTSLDEHFKTAAPLPTTHINWATPLPLKDAYPRMFDSNMQAVYELDDFESDVERMLPGVDTLTAKQAVMFLQEMQ